MARTILFERGFRIWDKWYEETYPNSPILGDENDDLRRILCVEHKYLKMDGCPLDFIQEVLYDQDGDMSPRYKNNPETAYLELTKDSWPDPNPMTPSGVLTYDDRRNKNWALGDNGWMIGGELMDFDPREDNHEEVTRLRLLYLYLIEEDLHKHRGAEYDMPEIHREYLNNVARELTDYGDIPMGEGYAGHFTLRELLSYMQNSQYMKGEVLRMFITGPSNVPWHHFFSDIINPDADRYVQMMKRAIRETIPVKVRRKATGERPIFNRLQKKYSNSWDDGNGLPVGTYKNMGDCEKMIDKWRDEKAITVTQYNNLRERLDVENFGFSEPTSLFSDRKASHKWDTRQRTSVLLPRKQNKVNALKTQRFHRTTALTPLAEFMLVNGGLDRPLADAYSVLARRDPINHMSVPEGVGQISDVPPDLPKGKGAGGDLRREIERADRLGHNVSQIKADSASYPMLSEFAEMIEPTPGEVSPDFSGETVINRNLDKKSSNFGLISDIHAIDKDEYRPLRPKDLFERAKRQRWWEMNAQPGEAGAVPKFFFTDLDDRHSLAYARERWSGDEYDAKQVPVSPIVAVPLSRMISPQAVMRLLTLDHIGALTKDIQEGLELPKRGKELMSMFGKLLDACSLGFIGGAHKNNLTVDHNHGIQTREQAQRQMELQAIHGADIWLQGGDGSVTQQGASRSSATRASYSGGWRNKQGTQSEEHLLKKARDVFTMHLIGGANCEMLRYGKESVHFLKVLGYPGAGDLLGETVIRYPEAFRKILRHSPTMKDLPKEFLEFETPFLPDGNFKNLWAMTYASKMQEGGVARPVHWRDSIEKEKHLYKLEEDTQGKYYYLPMQRVGETELYVPVTEPNDSVPWQEGAGVPKGTRLHMWLGKRPAMDRGRLEPFDLAHAYEDRFKDEDAHRDLRNLFAFPRLRVPLQSVVEIEGVPMLLGDHPSELLAEWSDFLRSVPQNVLTDWFGPGVVDVPERIMNRARQDAQVSGVDIGAEEEATAKSGLTKGVLEEALRHQHNAQTTIAGMFDLMASHYARKDAEKRPEIYDELSPGEIVNRYWENNITLHDGLTDDEMRRRETLQHAIKSACLANIGRMDPNAIEDLIRHHREFMEDDMITHWAGDDYIEDVFKPATAKTAMGVHNIIVDSIDSPMADPKHPMRQVLAKRGDRQALGHEILRAYLMGNSEVADILGQLGITREGALEKLSDIVGSVPEQKQRGGIDSNIRDMRVAGHHDGLAGGRLPLDWWEEWLTKEGKEKIKTSQRKKAQEAAMKRGYDLNPDDVLGIAGGYIPSKEILARRQGAYARQSMDLRKIWGDKLIAGHTGLREILNEVGFLIQGGVEGRSVVDVIRSDLNSFRNAKQRLRPRDYTFPEHRNSINPNGSERDPLSDRLSNLAQFIFCEGRTGVAGEKVTVGRASKGSRERKLPLGLKYTSSKGGEDFTEYERRLFSGVSNQVDISGSTLPSYHTNPVVLDQYGVSARGDDREHSILNENATNVIRGERVPSLDDREFRNADNVPASQSPVDIHASLDVLTDVDLLLKDDDKGKEKGKPLPIKAMHRIFKLRDLDHLRGFSDDWVVSSWPHGERVMVSKEKERLRAYNHLGDNITLSNKVKEGLKEAFDKNFLIDCIWDEEMLHIVDILESGKEKLDNSPTKDRNRHLRTNFSATEEVSIPAPINTKRVDSEGLERAVKDLMKESGVKQVLLRDADASYMRGENRHPKWVMLTPEHQIDVRVIFSRANNHCLGIGPILTEDALELGNRSRKFKGEHYMDVGRLPHKDLKRGDFITVSISGVSSRKRNGMSVYTLQSPRYVKPSESGATDSIDSLGIIANKKRRNVPHKVRVNKGSVHIEFPVGHVVYDTEEVGNAFMLKSVDAPNDYVLKLVESQVEYWEPLAAVLLRSEKEAVVPEPPANHDKKPKKVLPKKDQLLKDPEVVKGMVFALEVIEGLLKEKITWTGPKALGIDYATPVESPHGPTKVTEPYDLPDHDPAARQADPKACWCGAERGEDCKQGIGHKMEDCPKAHPPKKKKKASHLKVSQDSQPL